MPKRFRGAGYWPQACRCPYPAEKRRRSRSLTRSVGRPAAGAGVKDRPLKPVYNAAFFVCNLVNHRRLGGGLGVQRIRSKSVPFAPTTGLRQPAGVAFNARRKSRHQHRPNEGHLPVHSIRPVQQACQARKGKGKGKSNRTHTSEDQADRRPSDPPHHNAYAQTCSGKEKKSGVERWHRRFAFLTRS